MKRLIACAVALHGVASIFAHEINLQTGRLKNDIAPSVDFFVATYKHKEYRIGAFTSPTAQGVVASYTTQGTPFIFELGQREKSLEQGFLVGNGAYLPWTKNFAFAEPIGVRSGYETRYVSVDSSYYQSEAQNIAATRATFTPAAWFRISGGAAAQNIESAERAIPVASLGFGSKNERGFLGGAEFAGAGNYLLHARYAGDFLLRGLAFRRGGENPLASGIYANSEGIVLQGISEAWFAQYFQTDTRFAMLRYAGSHLTGVAVYEEKTQLAGLSLRNSATGFHLRSGATLAVDGSLQTLAGFGYADYIFLGGGHYALVSEQPLEPVIFPSEWYSSVMLQSSGMRVKDRGYKMMALVNTEAVQGFFAVTYAEDARGRERFAFYMRIAGGMTF